MKKISLIALALITSTVLFAQNEAPASKTTFGIKAGANLSKLRPSDLPSGFDLSTNLKTSFAGGFLVNFPIGTGGLAFQPELLFSGQGSKMNLKTPTITGGTQTQKYEQDLRYLSLPLMLQWRSTNGFYAEVGPQASFLLDARQDGPDDTNVENEDDFEKFEIAGGAGLGFVSRMGLGIGARYNHGFSNVWDNESTTTSSNNPRARHSVIHIGLIYHFGMNK